MIVLIFFIFGNLPKRHFWKKNPKTFFLQFSFIIGIVEWWRHINGVLPVFDRLLDRSLSYSDVIKYYDVIRAKSFFFYWKISIGFFSTNDAFKFSQKSLISKYHGGFTMIIVWIFFPQMTLSGFPKIHFLNLSWIFFPWMTLSSFPKFWIFSQNTRVWVKNSINS